MGEAGEQHELWEGVGAASAAPAKVDLLSELNEEQRAAVTHTDGPLLILAGPGSGKTRVITTRIAHLVLDHGVPAESVLAITFTNKAAREMRERTARLIGEGGAWISTFHSMCARILRREIEGLGGGWTRDYSIYDTADRNQLLRKLIKETGYDTTRFKPATLGAWISEVKSARATGEPGGELEGGGIEEEVLRKVYTRYVASLEENNALDFDDLQLKTLELFERHPAVRDAYARRFRYVMVDEYQDTNRVQYLLARHLSSAHGNLAVCGDPDQSIYSWRGADIRNILDFEQDYPDPAVVKLERNYRSSGNILRAAQAVISNNTARKPKELITDRDDGEPVRVFLCGDENDEATEIGHRIQSHLARGRRASEIAVFYRLNFMQRALETTFTRQRISYQVLGGVEFFQRKEIRDLIAGSGREIESGAELVRRADELGAARAAGQARAHESNQLGSAATSCTASARATNGAASSAIDADTARARVRAAGSGGCNTKADCARGKRRKRSEGRRVGAEGAIEICWSFPRIRSSSTT